MDHNVESLSYNSRRQGKLSLLPKCDVKMYKVKLLKLQSLPSAIYKVQSALYKVQMYKVKMRKKSANEKEKMQKVQIYKVKMYKVQMQTSENV